MDYSECFFDINVDGVSKGRVVFQLSSNTLPKTSRNFLALCTGEHKNTTGQRLHYKGSQFHGILPINGILLGGDIKNGNGTSGESIYDGNFENEAPSCGFEKPGTLAMLSWGPKENNSQFFICLDKQDKDAYPYNTAFGHVTSGLDVLKDLRKLGDKNGYPTATIRIENCGKL